MAEILRDYNWQVITLAEISVLEAAPTLWRKYTVLKKKIVIFVLGIQIGFLKSLCFKESLTFKNWTPLQSNIFSDVF